MPLSALTDREAVLAAISEYDRLGKAEFLKKYRYGPARGYFLLHDGKRYDSKAIAGVAVGKQFPADGPLRSEDFTGGDVTVKPKLEQLGFIVVGPTVSLPAPRADVPRTTFAIAPTDRDWFDTMRSLSTGLLSNFWTPTPWHVAGLPAGARLYFLLKSPVRKVAGYGRFVRYEDMTVGEAWRAFGPGNGVNSEAELLGRVSGFAEKRAKTFVSSDNPEIGCVILQDLVILDDERWITPEDAGHSFPRQVVKLKYFTEVDGFEASLADLRRMALGSFSLVGGQAGRRTSSSKDRKGQSAFRQLILSNYGARCCVSGTKVVELLEAAHIQPYVNEQSNHHQNGLCLRVDLHRLFDAGLITLSPDLKVVVSEVLSGSTYASLDGKKLRNPSSERDRPSGAALDFHRTQVFRRSAK